VKEDVEINARRITRLKERIAKLDQFMAQSSVRIQRVKKVCCLVI
jgi:hypothetical protein